MRAARVDAVETAVYRFPTPEPESDGTLTWDATTAVTVTVHAAGMVGLGWTYSTAAAAAVVRDHLAPAVTGQDADDITACWRDMHRACRNFGTRGIAMQAISAVDIALWDLKAQLHERPLHRLFGRARDNVPVYGSGGFTSLTDGQLGGQVESWRQAGCAAMKIKIGERWGECPDRDIERVAMLQRFAGPSVELMVDANGAYQLGQARRVGTRLDELGVVWFEEPVSSDDVSGLAELRAVLDCDVAAGEYVADLADARALVDAVDCLQLDATRCGGYTGFLRAAALAQAHQRAVSAHCAPAVHLPVAAAVANLRHVEWFADHAALEPQLVSGVVEVRDGAMPLVDDHSGHGYRLNDEAAGYLVGPVEFADRPPASGHPVRTGRASS
jgi:L-alanine-DL-glutamate epimerase-like enolase superfamily enzyme